MVTAVGILAAVVTVLATFFLSMIIFFKKRYRFWAERGVIGPEPEFFFGNFKNTMLVKMTEAEAVSHIAPKFKDKKVIGLYNLWKPVFLAKDYEVVKRVLEKDADYFIDRPPMLSDELTDYAFYSLITMEGEVWRTRRHVLSKLFTPKKLKEYLEDMRPAVTTLTEKLGGEMELMEPITAFTTHAAVKALYALDLSKDPARTKELLRMIERFFRPPTSTSVKMLTYNIWPGLFKFFKIGVMSEDIWHFAKRLYDEMAQARTSLNVERDDGLTVIMKMQNEGAPTFDKIEYKEAVGHTFQMLVASLHTTALVDVHTLYFLSHHPEVQKKAREEVEEVLKGAETITYEHIAEMKYLDNILLESMRLVPVTGIMKRTCNKDYELTEGVTVRSGEDVWVDVNSVHRDPKIFPEPLKFMPERWESPELSEAGANFAFGRGPRLCIGKRMSEIMSKLMLSTVLPKFDILPSEKNHSPLRYDPNTIILSSIPLDGIFVKFKPRD